LSRHSNKFQPAIIIDEPVSGSMKPINSIIVVENNSGAALVWSNQFPRLRRRAIMSACTSS
jgi:hypothetical protein